MVITVRNYTPEVVGDKDEGFNVQEQFPKQQLDAVEKIVELEKESQEEINIDEIRRGEEPSEPVTGIVEGEYFTTRKTLMQNPQFMNAARDFLQDKYNVAGTGLFNGRKIKDASDEEIYDKWLEHFRHFDSNIGTTMFDLHYVTAGQGSTTEKRNQYAYLLNNYEVLQGEWSSVGGVVQSLMDYGEGMATDPTNLVALIPFFGQGTKLTTVAAHKVLKDRIKEYLKTYAKTFATSGAIGGGFAAAHNVIRQNTQLQSDAKEEFDFGEFALTVGVGGAISGTLGGLVKTLGQVKAVKNQQLIAKGKENYQKNLDIKHEQATKNLNTDEIKEIEELQKLIDDDLIDNDFYRGMADLGKASRDEVAEGTGIDKPLTVGVDVGREELQGTIRNVAAMAMDVIRNLSPEDKLKYLKGVKLKGKTGEDNKRISHVIFDLLADRKIGDEQYGLLLKKYGLDHSDFKLMWWSTVSDAGAILQKQSEVVKVARNSLKQLANLDDVSAYKTVEDMKVTDAIIADAHNTNASSIGQKVFVDLKNLTDVAKGSMVVMPSTAVRNYIGSGIKLSIRGLAETMHGGFTAIKHGVLKATGKSDGTPLKHKTRVFSGYTGVFRPFKTLGAIFDRPGNENLARDILDFYDNVNVKYNKAKAKEGKASEASFRSKADDLFTNYLEIEQRLTGGIIPDNAWGYANKIVNIANIFNRTQEYSIRGAVFIDTLDRIATQKGTYNKLLDLDGNPINTFDELVSSGKIKDVFSEEDLAEATQEALDATYALEPPKGILLNILNWIRSAQRSPITEGKKTKGKKTKGKKTKGTKTQQGPGFIEGTSKLIATTFVPFPRFVYNATHTALRYSPIGAARGIWGIGRKSLAKETLNYKDWTKFNEGIIGTAVVFGLVEARLRDAIGVGGRQRDEQDGFFRVDEGPLVEESPYQVSGEKPDRSFVQSQKLFGEETNVINVGGGVQGDITPFFPGSYFNALSKFIFDYNYRPENVNVSLLVKDFARSTIGSTVRTGALGHSIDELYKNLEETGALSTADIEALKDVGLYEKESGIRALNALEKALTSERATRFGEAVASRWIPFMVSMQAIDDIWSTYDPEEAKLRESSYQGFTNRMAARIPGYKKYLLEKQDPFQEQTPQRVAGLLTQVSGVRFSTETPWVEGELLRLGIEPWKLVSVRDGEIPYYTIAMRKELGRKMQHIENVGIPMMLVSQDYLDQDDKKRKFLIEDFVAAAKAEALLEVQNTFVYLDEARTLALMNDRKVYDIMQSEPYRDISQEIEMLVKTEIDEGIEDKLTGDRTISDAPGGFQVGIGEYGGTEIPEEKRSGLLAPIK
jgi:hypothetical protein